MYKDELRYEVEIIDEKTTLCLLEPLAQSVPRPIDGIVTGHHSLSEK